jgi:hypothetical protein
VKHISQQEHFNKDCQIYTHLEELSEDTEARQAVGNEVTVLLERMKTLDVVLMTAL